LNKHIDDYETQNYLPSVKNNDEFIISDGDGEEEIKYFNEESETTSGYNTQSDMGEKFSERTTLKASEPESSGINNEDEEKSIDILKSSINKKLSALSAHINIFNDSILN
jgi:hypothetical protein